MFYLDHLGTIVETDTEPTETRYDGSKTQCFETVLELHKLISLQEKDFQKYKSVRYVRGTIDNESFYQDDFALQKSMYYYILRTRYNVPIELIEQIDDVTNDMINYWY